MIDKKNRYKIVKQNAKFIKWWFLSFVCLLKGKSKKKIFTFTLFLFCKIYLDIS